jgi:hypothetical protein
MRDVYAVKRDLILIKKDTYKIIIDGKEIDISKESYEAFKAQFKGE